LPAPGWTLCVALEHGVQEHTMIWEYLALAVLLVMVPLLFLMLL
jgi:hypothetical protein